MREFRGLSTRELGTLLKVSHSGIHLIETGRADIKREYVERFLAVLKFSTDDWETFKKDGQSIEALREECLMLLQIANPSNLKSIHAFIRDNDQVLFAIVILYLK